MISFYETHQIHNNTNNGVLRWRIFSIKRKKITSKMYLIYIYTSMSNSVE